MSSSSFTSQASIYLSIEWRYALAYNDPLPQNAIGASLIADISGFTSLADALVKAYGMRQGAEDLSKYLDQIYTQIVASVDNYGGSVIGFAGDAITCWFDDKLPWNPISDSGARRAAACALEIQAIVNRFQTSTTPIAIRHLDGFNSTPITVKVAIAKGPVRRYCVGDFAIQRFPILVGSVLERMSSGEGLVFGGEILIDEAAASDLRIDTGRLEIRKSHNGDSFAVLDTIPDKVAYSPWPVIPEEYLQEEDLVQWLLADIYQRLKAGLGDLIPEIRPVSVLFLRFYATDYENDENAGAKLNEYICRAQQIVSGQDGTLLGITIGDKGSYLYAAFGALVAHEDDPHRAVSAAVALRNMSNRLDWMRPVQIGVAKGALFAGSYGGTTRRTYGILGDDVNLAARLMTCAQGGEILVSGRIQWALTNRNDKLAELFQIIPHEPVLVKGKPEPITAYTVVGSQRRFNPPATKQLRYLPPIIGRSAEINKISDCLDQALTGAGKILGVVGEAGIGKTRLLAEVVRLARQKGYADHTGACQADGTNASYVAWSEIWKQLLRVDPDNPVEHQVGQVYQSINQHIPNRANAVPLLATMLGLPFQENEFTSGLEPKYRRSALEALLLDYLRVLSAKASDNGQGLLLVIDDCQWIDPASLDLLLLVARAAQQMAIVVILGYRPSGDKSNRLREVEAAHSFNKIPLFELGPNETQSIVLGRINYLYPMSKGAVPADLIEKIANRSQGNPFYAEELLNYLKDQDKDVRDPGLVDSLDLPESLYSLVLSRIDQLTAHQQSVLKVASIIGRLFKSNHLSGYYPNLGTANEVRLDLEVLASLELVLRDAPAPDLVYLFRHIITREVAYDSLPYNIRTMLHEKYAQFIEELGGDHLEPYLDILAYHYERSQNIDKKFHYYRLAGESAAARYANVEAVDYITRALTLDRTIHLEEHLELLMTREKVLDLIADREAQRLDLEEMERIALKLECDSGDSRYRAQVALRWANYHLMTSDFTSSQSWAEDALRYAGADDPTTQASGYLAIGMTAQRRGEFDDASTKLEKAYEFARAAQNARLSADCLFRLGNIMSEAGHFIEAEGYNLRALEIYREKSYQLGESNTLILLGRIARSRGEITQAKMYWEQALRIAHSLGDRRYESIIRGNLACIYGDQGDMVASEKLFRQALELAREAGDKNGEGIWLIDLGDAVLSQGDILSARKYFQQAREIFQKIASKGWEAFCCVSLAQTSRLAGEFEVAAEVAQQGLELSREIHFEIPENNALCELSLIELYRGHAEAAQASIQAAIDQASSFEDHAPLASALFIKGRILESCEEPHEASFGLYQKAQEYFHQIAGENFRNKNQEVEVMAGLARVQLSQGHREQALGTVETIILHLNSCPTLFASWDPALVYLTCHDVLKASGDSRASWALEKGTGLLRKFAGGLVGMGVDESAVINTPSSHDLFGAWRKHHVGKRPIYVQQRAKSKKRGRSD